MLMNNVMRSLIRQIQIYVIASTNLSHNFLRREWSEIRRKYLCAIRRQIAHVCQLLFSCKTLLLKRHWYWCRSFTQLSIINNKVRYSVDKIQHIAGTVSGFCSGYSWLSELAKAVTAACESTITQWSQFIRGCEESVLNLSLFGEIALETQYIVPNHLATRLRDVDITIITFIQCMHTSIRSHHHSNKRNDNISSSSNVLSGILPLQGWEGAPLLRTGRGRGCPPATAHSRRSSPAAPSPQTARCDQNTYRVSKHAQNKLETMTNMQ